MTIDFISKNFVDYYGKLRLEKLKEQFNKKLIFCSKSHEIV